MSLSAIRRMVARSLRGPARSIPSNAGAKLAEIRRWGYLRPDLVGAGRYSQCGQDTFVISLLNGMRGGIFLDIGAYDGRSFSNSLLLEEEYGWTGICVEPNPGPFAKLQSCRSAICVNAAIGAREGTVEFTTYTGYGEMLSGIKDKTKDDELNEHAKTHHIESSTISVECKTVDGILKDHGIDHVDYVSVDTEGMEMEILQSIDLRRLQVRVVTVENNMDDRARMESFFRSHGYSLAAILSNDEVYTRIA